MTRLRQNNNNINSYQKNKYFKCPKCKQQIEKNLKKDHLYSHQIDDAEKRRNNTRIQFNNNERRYNRQLRNQMNNPIVIRIRPNNNDNNNNRNNNNDDFGIINGFLGMLGQGMEFSINHQRQRNNNRNINRNNRSYENRNNQNFNFNRRYNPNFNRRLNFNDNIFSFNIDRNRNDGKHALNNFNEIVIEDINKLEEGNKRCSICLEEFSNNEKVTSLPCIHFFHTPCIKNWIKRQNTCPVCKFELTQENLNNKIRENQ